jgi:N utilization substance protein B
MSIFNKSISSKNSSRSLICDESPQTPTDRTQYNRRKSRELCLQSLFQVEYESKGSMHLEKAPVLVMDQLLAHFEIDISAKDYALILFEGVLKEQTTIDSMLSAQSDRWKIERMSVVDRNVLRIAIFELKYLSDDVPRNVAINEAIEVSKKYGSSESGSFVNGILDQINRLQ